MTFAIITTQFIKETLYTNELRVTYLVSTTSGSNETGISNNVVISELQHNYTEHKILSLRLGLMHVNDAIVQVALLALLGRVRP